MVRTLDSSGFVSSSVRAYWSVPSPPGHGNFAEAPQIYRGPYEYSVPGREEDWFPQNVAPEGTTGA